jgi:large subunit ribosomal protein L3
MSLKFIGKKKGMTQLFDENGHAVACTVILAEPNVVTQKKDVESDGYKALQLGSFSAKEKSFSKPLLGHFAKTKISPKKHLLESKVESTKEFEVGQEIDASYFAPGDFIDVSGVSKGKGFQGVMKLYGFSGGPAAHGSGFHRHAGSTGMRSTPGICFRGGKRASRMGGYSKTTQSLKILVVDAEKKMIIVRGSIPGYNGSIVYLAKAIKKKTAKKS